MLGDTGIGGRGDAVPPSPARAVLPLLPTWHRSCRAVEGGGLEESLRGVPPTDSPPVLHLQPPAHPCDTMGGSFHLALRI